MSASGPGWTDWRDLPGVPRLDDRVLREILDGGQSFRWHPLAQGDWIGVWDDNVVRVRLHRGQVQWTTPVALIDRVERALPRYFGTEVDFAGLTDALPWRSDPHLARCIDAFRGLRLLRQPFAETLLGFLCSATKQIVQIKQMLGLLAERHGTPISGASAAAGTRSATTGAKTAAVPPNRLPTWDELAGIPEAELRRCLLGFRARYISETAQFLHAHRRWLEETERLPYVDAKARLCLLPGVGEKVADCVLLFGAGRFEAFPVDVWILKTMARRYGLETWKPAQLAQFGRVHFGPCAGFAQQYLFAGERSVRRAEPGTR